jgi:hypothetical protein
MALIYLKIALIRQKAFILSPVVKVGNLDADTVLIAL